MRYFKVCLIAILFFACNKDENSGALVMRNVAYGTAPEQKMDIHLPASRSATTTKVIILIHGGAWNAGDKADFEAYVDTLKKREPTYAIFNLNYRLATNSSTLFPAQEQDINTAVNYINSKTDEYQVSKKFVIIGASAGAHLGLLHAYKFPNNIKAVVDFFGPTDLVALYNNPPGPLVPVMLQQVTGGTPATLPNLYQSSSPINFVSATAPPTLVFHGDVDPIVPLAQSNALVLALQSYNVTSQYIVYQGEGHSWVGPNLSDSFNKIQAFLTAHVQ